MSEHYEQLAPAYALYYDTYYPYEDIVTWLTYRCTIPTARREWSYEAMTCNDETFVARFREVQTSDQLRQMLHFSPTTFEDFKLKLDIGPVYSHDMNQRKMQHNFIPLEREFVFDIDAGDFDRVRTCCQGSAICSMCWRYMELAVPLLILFCRVYGFSRYFFAFSGRRGIHCWICDEHARKLLQEDRKYMLKPFEMISADTSNLLHISYDHSNWLCSIIHDHICVKFFTKMLEEQEWLRGDVKGYLESHSKSDLIAEVRQADSKLLLSAPIFQFLRTVLSIYSYLLSVDLPLTISTVKNADGKFMSLIATFIGKLTLQSSSLGRWSEFEMLLKDFEPVVAATRVYYTYPRFDIEVTRGMNHLLKVPFSIHSKCRKISVPFPAAPIFREYSIDTKVIQLDSMDTDEVLPRFLPSLCPNVDDLVAGKREVYDLYRSYFSRIVAQVSA